jgi:hypothetical protein
MKSGKYIADLAAALEKKKTMTVTVSSGIATSWMKKMRGMTVTETVTVVVPA